MKFGMTASLVFATLVLAIPVVSSGRFASRETIRIERIMACNRHNAQDEVGDFEDYIDLYNRTENTVAVGGMYLSDSTDRRQWKIPDNTLIEAKSTLRIWTDGEPEEGPLHANFRLNRSGERVMLFSSDDEGNVLLDAVVFPRQQTDTVYLVAR